LSKEHSRFAPCSTCWTASFQWWTRGSTPLWPPPKSFARHNAMRVLFAFPYPLFRTQLIFGLCGGPANLFLSTSVLACVSYSSVRTRWGCCLGEECLLPFPNMADSGLTHHYQARPLSSGSTTPTQRVVLSSSPSRLAFCMQPLVLLCFLLSSS
jgi:hypothetical protein